MSTGAESLALGATSYESFLLEEPRRLAFSLHWRLRSEVTNFMAQVSRWDGRAARITSVRVGFLVNGHRELAPSCLSFTLALPAAAPRSFRLVCKAETWLLQDICSCGLPAYENSVSCLACGEARPPTTMIHPVAIHAPIPWQESRSRALSAIEQVLEWAIPRGGELEDLLWMPDLVAFVQETWVLLLNYNADS